MKECDNCDMFKPGCERHCPIEKSRTDKHRSDINKKKNRRNARERKTAGYFYGEELEK